MRRRSVLKPAMTKLGIKPNGGNAKSRLCFVIPVSCAFLFVLSYASLLVFNLNTKPPEPEVSIAIMATPVALPSLTPPPSPPPSLHPPSSPPSSPPPPAMAVARSVASVPDDRCTGRYIYIHDLPRRFNSDMLRNCRTLSRWTDMCLFTSNAGLGPRLDNSGGVFSGRAWYATNQFALEVIFHNRMKQYDCLTENASLAVAIFVPFYAGLDISRYLWESTMSQRDAASRDLFRWLKTRPEWLAMGGRDHFMVAGRITWDFQRPTDDDSDWGNKLLLLPETKNMTVLVIESSPWNSNDFGIPYPTYFHPSNDGEVRAWQDRMRRTKRSWLFSFAGAPRPDEESAWIRNAVIGQCRRSRRCKLLECGIGNSKCHLPGSVMRMFEHSTFCLQPQGDSYTRRSTFDAMVAGCVPVFFHPGAAYVQYTWHLPRNYSKYSVFIPEDEMREGKVRNIEEMLKRIKKKDVKAMREEVIRMIPRLIYADPRARGPQRVRDAFDLAVEGVIQRVKDIKRGRAPVFKERESWKYALGSREMREWDHFFGNPRS
ncbi:xyloglucan galactosyltransferase [Canna indica]|uniref:Xyloglucan galactosyltransferase n=1 Tax=Canna indica TaxID=4628 RepID=A0AAQ3KXI0_9LILI|nr:xyloglucan galactosyltransferase [Canna indica]